MKWTNETITARLNEIENARREKKVKFDTELKESRAKLANLETALSEAEDPDEYKRILREKNEAETYIDFLTRRTKGGKKYDDVSNDEYKDMQSFLLDQMEKTQTEYAPKIEKKLSELLNVLEEYYSKANTSENVRDRACNVFLGHGISGHKTSEIIGKMNDPLFYAEHIIRPFFNHRMTIQYCYNRVEMGRTQQTPWNQFTVEQNKICEELKKRMNKK